MTAHASFFESFLWQGVTYQSSYCTCISCKYIIQIRKGFVNLQKPGHWPSSISACFFTAPKNIWAKTDPFQSIETHSILAGITAQTIWDRMLPPGVQIQLEQLLSCERIQVRAWLGYLVSLHDLGKVEENFQYQWPEMKQRMDEAGLKPAFFTGKVQHEKTTAASLRNHIWPNTTEAKRLLRFYAGILEAHHQGKVGNVGV